MTRGRKIRVLREQRGMTQGGLAKASGVSRATINRLENDSKFEPELTTLKAVAEALDVRYEEIVELEHKPAPASEVLSAIQGIIDSGQRIAIADIDWLRGLPQEFWSQWGVSQQSLTVLLQAKSKLAK